MIMQNERGVTVILVLTFMGIFLFLLGTILSYTLTQGRYGRALYAREQAVNVAEAGLEFYRWFLAHNSSVMTTGVGLVSPLSYEVRDPEGGVIGTAEVTATPNTACGVVQSIDLSSEGVAVSNPVFKRTLKARYMRPSVAEYSNIINANVWAGSDRNITGAYHSNGGIRMDGTNNSIVSSAVATWSCTSSFGCSPTQNQPGVFGAGAGSALWEHPTASFDFAGISSDFPTLRTYAQNQGILLTSTRIYVDGVQQGNNFGGVGGTEQRGFRIVMNANNTIDIYRVVSTGSAQARRPNNLGQWVSDYHAVNNEIHLGTYTIQDDCPLIYSDAKVWLQGVVGRKVTVIAADTGVFDPDILLSNNITYSSGVGASGLTAIAEQSVVVPLVSPDEMTIRGIFVAQKGYFGRNYYETSGSHGVPAQYNAYVTRTRLTTIGSVVSNGRIGTQWSCGGNLCSGYGVRTDTYDRLLAFDPPPFTPAASPDYKLVLWREQ